jgi:hypothetical protein
VSAGRKEIVMEIKTKFEIGQEVFAIYNTEKRVAEICPTCNGTRKVTINDKLFACPNNCSYGYVYVYTPKHWLIETNSQVGNVRADIFGDREKIEYMLISTGVGSGRLWNESDLFPTREEAEAECARRNQEVGK